MPVSRYLDPKNDIAFKRIFGTERNKDILIEFINDIMQYEDGERIKEVSFLSPVQDPDIAYRKQSIVDVLCRAINGVQIIVEMQVSPQEGFTKRAQYYAAKAYSRQLKKGSEEGARYKDLKAVIFIAISDYKIFTDKENYISRHIMMDEKTYEHDLKDFSFTFIELPKFKKEKIDELHSMAEKWCYFFKYAYKTKQQDLDNIIGSDIVIKRAYEALDQFNWTEQELIAYEQEIKRVMDNQAAEDYLIRIATEKGMEKGMEKRSIEIAKKLLEQKIDIKTISISTGLSEEEIKNLC